MLSLRYNTREARGGVVVSALDFRSEDLRVDGSSLGRSLRCLVAHQTNTFTPFSLFEVAGETLRWA